uniref:centromere protein O-like n=1 Tax=Jaculus jaculus TaxID=51337 RepID=UPI001E1AF994|nr:centromere protein O-like [Jaculus jaculus]
MAHHVREDGESKGGILVHLERLETQRNQSHEKSEELPRVIPSHRLSGKLTSHGVCVSISTAFEGNLLDFYLVDLVIERPLWIHHHSIPVLISLENIAVKHLQTNIQCFLFSLCEHLNACSGRKYQADQLESDFTAFLTGPLQKNFLCHLLSFTYKVDQEHQSLLSARLLYEDLTGTLPTDVTIMHQGMETEALSNSWEKHRLAHERLLLTEPSTIFPWTYKTKRMSILAYGFYFTHIFPFRTCEAPVCVLPQTDISPPDRKELRTH